MTALLYAITIADDLRLWRLDSSPTPYIHLREVADAIGYSAHDKRRLIGKWRGELLPLPHVTVKAIHAINPSLPSRLRGGDDALLPVDVFLQRLGEAIATFAPTHRENLHSLAGTIAQAWQGLQGQQRGEEDLRADCTRADRPISVLTS